MRSCNAAAALTPEEHRDKIRRGYQKHTPETLRARAAKGVASLSPEARSDRSRRANYSRTRAERVASSLKAHAAQTPQQRRDRQLRAAETARIRGKHGGGRKLKRGYFYAFALSCGAVMVGITSNLRKRRSSYACGQRKHRSPPAGKFKGFDFVSKEIAHPFKREQAVLRHFRELGYVVDGEAIEGVELREVVEVFNG